MRSLLRAVVPALLALAPTVAWAADPPPGADYEGQAFTFHPIRDGIYHAVGTGAVAVGCNGAVIVNDSDVLVVDSHMTPLAAWALLSELRAITDKPVRYLVNTHFHFDHVHGNEIFGPEVEIVAHEFTHRKIVSGDTKRGRGYELFVGTTPDRIRQLEGQLADMPDEERAATEERITRMRRFWESQEAAMPSAPTATLTRRMTLHRGGREIQLLFLGRGHTGGDVVVYLPAEKVLVTGDLLTHGLPYMGDAHFAEWVDTLEALKALDVEVILPGHGPAFEEVEKIGYLQDYLRELLAEATRLHAEGVPAADAAGQIDMRSHAEHYPRIEEVGVHPHAVERIYELLDGGG